MNKLRCIIAHHQSIHRWCPPSPPSLLTSGEGRRERVPFRQPHTPSLRGRQRCRYQSGHQADQVSAKNFLGMTQNYSILNKRSKTSTFASRVFPFYFSSNTALNKLLNGPPPRPPQSIVFWVAQMPRWSNDLPTSPCFAFIIMPRSDLCFGSISWCWLSLLVS